MRKHVAAAEESLSVLLKPRPSGRDVFSSQFSLGTELAEIFLQRPLAPKDASVVSRVPVPARGAQDSCSLFVTSRGRDD